ncbi:MAG TPA: hypothetical protein VJ861_10345 [Treponemataceae bacterium]|nr:hypothetical protein [Treponemataceae bacterium]
MKEKTIPLAGKGKLYSSWHGKIFSPCECKNLKDSVIRLAASPIISKQRIVAYWN